MFNVRVDLGESGQVFLMNTLTDAQLLVSEEVTGLLDRLSGPQATTTGTWTEAERGALGLLIDQGFVVPSRAAERAMLDRFFKDVRGDSRELRVTVLTTLQCNFACHYCIQGDHGGPGSKASRMSLDAADRLARWIETRLGEVQPQRFSLCFFGGEPLLNQPVMFRLAERLWQICGDRHLPMHVDLITNGLLLTREVVDRLGQYGLNGVKVTLDGDQATHDRMRPLRGGQGTFHRIIENIRQVADRCRITIGGNFDEGSIASYPALLDFLKAQEFADKLAKVSFKPVIRKSTSQSPGSIPLTLVGPNGEMAGGAGCGTGAGRSGNLCDTCHLVQDHMTFVRQETERRGFPTVDGVHMGPCEIHHRHAYTVAPDGSVYACPGFATERGLAIDHIDGRTTARHTRAAEEFEGLAAWKQCGDCAFIPVCAGGCAVASHVASGDVAAPTCYKSSFESALIGLAEKAASLDLVEEETHEDQDREQEEP